MKYKAFVKAKPPVAKGPKQTLSEHDSGQITFLRLETHRGWPLWKRWYKHGDRPPTVRNYITRFHWDADQGPESVSREELFREFVYDGRSFCLDIPEDPLEARVRKEMKAYKANPAANLCLLQRITDLEDAAEGVAADVKMAKVWLECILLDLSRFEAGATAAPSFIPTTRDLEDLWEDLEVLWEGLEDMWEDLQAREGDPRTAIVLAVFLELTVDHRDRVPEKPLWAEAEDLYRILKAIRKRTGCGCRCGSHKGGSTRGGCRCPCLLESKLVPDSTGASIGGAKTTHSTDDCGGHCCFHTLPAYEKDEK